MAAKECYASYYLLHHAFYVLTHLLTYLLSYVDNTVY